jgi:hypothetical protein
MKITLSNDFDILSQFDDEVLKQWLVTIVNKNGDCFSAIDQVQLECKEVEEQFFSPQVKQEIVIALMKIFIDSWIKNVMEHIFIQK